MTTATSRALVEQEQATWQAYFDATRLLFEELDRRVSEDAGISLADFGVLARLADADEWGMRMSDLADSTVFSKSRISHAVDRLETLGLVERRACPTDRRGSYASLTEAGRDKLTEAMPGHSETVRRHLFEQLSTDEVDGFRASMTAVKKSLQEADPASVA
ncbi:MAG TPA: MarR family transcriptional regulator [Acidimicrobiia bacterium]